MFFFDEKFSKTHKKLSDAAVVDDNVVFVITLCKEILHFSICITGPSQVILFRNCYIVCEIKGVKTILL